MTVEYVLLIVVVFMFVVKGFLSAPAGAFKKSGPHLAARVEQQLATGDGFKKQGNLIKWNAP
jgi:hypothetical protein